MKIGILSRNRFLYSTQRLSAAARQRGHSVLVIDTLQLAQQLGIFPYLSRRRERRRPFPSVDAIIPRIGASITVYGVAVVRRFESYGTLTTATSQAITRSRNKLESWQLMSGAGLPLPKTVLVSQESELPAAVAAVGGPPVVVKILKGTQGRGVILAPTMAAAQTVLSVLFQHGQQRLLLQEYIQEAEGRDLRLLIVGRCCVAAMERIAPDGEFRANLHQGGHSAPLTPGEEIEQLAVQAAALHGIGVAGVDIICSDRGPLLLEVNSSPGLEGIERTTQVDIASKIITYLEKKKGETSRKRRRSR